MNAVAVGELPSVGVGGVAKFPKFVPDSAGTNFRLKMFWNSTRTCKLYRLSGPKRKLRARFALSFGRRALRKKGSWFV